MPHDHEHSPGAGVDFDAKARTWDDDPAKVARGRTVADAIAAAVPGLDRMNVLEYGSGTGLLGLALAPRLARLTMADGSREMTAVAREKIAAQRLGNVEAIQLDLTTGARPAGRFELVMTLLTLHHIPDLDAVLRAFHELLAPGGTVAISDLDEEDGSFHGHGFSGHRGLSRRRLADALVAAGFEPPRFETVLEIEKPTEAGELRRYPVFLALSKRP